MATTHNLPDNRTLVKGYFQDGLVELTVGVALALVGCTLFFPDSVFMLWYFPWMLGWLVLPQAKKQLIAPRGGVVEMPRSRPPAFKVIIGLLTLTLGIGVVAAFTAQDRRPSWLQPILVAVTWSIEHFPLVVGAGLAAIFAGLGSRSATPRFYAYALLFLVSGAIIDLSIASARIGGLVLLIAVGTLILIVGASHLIAFRREHPLLNENTANA